MAAEKKDETPAVKSELVKVRLRFGTVGRKRGDVLEVSKDEADRLVANGSAVKV